jgi:hypothetical protein
MAGQTGVENTRKQDKKGAVRAVLEPERSSSTRLIVYAAAAQKPPLPGGAGADDAGDRSSLTDVNPIVPELAPLSNLSNVPKLKRKLSAGDVASAPEAYIVSLIENSMSLQAILDVSPMKEEQTLHFLARLITSGLVTWADAGVRAW